MKNVAKVLSFVVIAGIGMAVIGCDSKPEPAKKPAAPAAAPAKTPDAPAEKK